MIEKNVRPAILSTDIRPAQIKCTDHLAISLKIINKTQRGPGYWKLNNSFLEDSDYITLINNTVDSCIRKFNNQSVKHSLLWELCKLEIKSQSTTYAIQKSKHKKDLLE